MLSSLALMVVRVILYGDTRLDAAEAQNIDFKIDDGHASRGDVQGYDGGAGVPGALCLTTGGEQDYILDQSGGVSYACLMAFYLDNRTTIGFD